MQTFGRDRQGEVSCGAENRLAACCPVFLMLQVGSQRRSWMETGGVIPALDRVNLQFGLQYERVGVRTTPQTAAALEIRELQDLDSAIADF
jgi:hypothetical protein